MKTKNIFKLGLALFFGAGLALTSCQDAESSLVDFDPKLDNPSDTVYSFMGIMKQIQVVGDRTILLGEVKSDLLRVAEKAGTDIAEIGNFDVKEKNQYNKAKDYYSIIQNCNYYIANCNTSLVIHGMNVFEREYAAVKAFRAWAYMQLAINYGTVPFYTKPLLTEEEANPDRLEKRDIVGICNYFIDDLKPYIDVLRPSYVDLNQVIPIRVLLGDMCLWAGRYSEAAQYYYDYLTRYDDPKPIGRNGIRWSNEKFENLAGAHSVRPLWNIGMEENSYNGVVSQLDDIFSSTEDNKYWYQVTSSQSLYELSSSQTCPIVVKDATTLLPDTVYPPEDKYYENGWMKGDLRYYGQVTTGTMNGVDDGYSTSYQHVARYTSAPTSIYQDCIALVYLRLAEAMNRMNLPQSAFAILKYGLCDEIVNSTEHTYISEDEKLRAGQLLVWDPTYFDDGNGKTGEDVTETNPANTIGVHSRGSGWAYADTLYTIPRLATMADSVEYVEERILDEMGLEGMFTGRRFGDVQRIALHRNDPTFLARKYAGRDGKDNFNMEMYDRLCDKNNWFLPLE